MATVQPAGTLPGMLRSKLMTSARAVKLKSKPAPKILPAHPISTSVQHECEDFLSSPNRYALRNLSENRTILENREDADPHRGRRSQARTPAQEGFGRTELFHDHRFRRERGPGGRPAREIRRAGA